MPNPEICLLLPNIAPLLMTMDTGIPPPPPVSEPFRAHLIALLSIYELGPLPRYEGPNDWQTDTVLRSLGAVAKRMWAAEEALTAYRVGTVNTIRAPCSDSIGTDAG